MKPVVPAAMFLSAAMLLTAPQMMGQPLFTQRIVYQHPLPAEIPPTGRVAELIGRLSDESPEQRHAAARALLKKGQAVALQLQWARHLGELEMEGSSWPSFQVPGRNPWREGLRDLRPWHGQNELDVLISRLDEQRCSKASLITLHHRDALLTHVLSDLGRQAQADVVVGTFGPSVDWVITNRVTVHVERASFWEALVAIHRVTGSGLIHPNGLNQLILSRGCPNPFSVGHGSVVSGPLLIAALPAVSERLGLDHKGRGMPVLRLTLQAFAEPKFSQLGAHGKVRLDQCVDDRGRSLIRDGQRTFFSTQNYNAVWSVPLELRQPGPGRRIKTLKGEFSVGAGPQDRRMTLTNLLQAQGQSRELDGLRVTVREVTPTGSQYRINVELSAPNDSPYSRAFSTAEELPVWIWADAPRTLNAQKVFLGVRRQGGRTVGSWTLITPENGPPPETLVWKTPTETRWHAVPFEFHDLGGTPGK